MLCPYQALQLRNAEVYLANEIINSPVSTESITLISMV